MWVTEAGPGRKHVSGGGNSLCKEARGWTDAATERNNEPARTPGRATWAPKGQMVYLRAVESAWGSNGSGRKGVLRSTFILEMMPPAGSRTLGGGWMEGIRDRAAWGVRGAMVRCGCGAAGASGAGAAGAVGTEQMDRSDTRGTRPTAVDAGWIQHERVTRECSPGFWLAREGAAAPRPSAG